MDIQQSEIGGDVLILLKPLFGDFPVAMCQDVVAMNIDCVAIIMETVNQVKTSFKEAQFHV